MRDNVAVEFGVPPATNVDDFVHYVTTAIADLNEYLPDNLELICTPSAHFPDYELNHKEARAFGCEPDYNAWDEDINEPPEGAAEGTFRSCGGHEHVGSELLQDIQSKIEFTKLMDCMHGYVATKLDDSDEAIARRFLYGKAGCYRPTDYGVEYRTMSNFWCKDEKLMKLIYHLTDDALHVFENNMHNELIDELGGEDQIRGVIDSGDSEMASEMINTVITKYMSDETVNLYREVS
jgi:hypothetical protein